MKFGLENALKEERNGKYRKEEYQVRRWGMSKGLMVSVIDTVRTKRPSCLSENVPSGGAYEKVEKTNE